MGAAADVAVGVVAEVADLAESEFFFLAVEDNARRGTAGEVVAHGHPGCGAGRTERGGKLLLTGLHKVVGGGL